MAEEGQGTNAAQQRQEVPVAQFIEDVEAYLEGKNVEDALNELRERYQQYKRVEARLQQQKIRLEQKVPEIERALSGVKLLEEKEGTEEGMDVDYELADNVYARAKVKGQRSVYLWLGASVMLEYWLDEARSLLERNLANAKESLEKNRRDMDTLRESITITEVSIARVYNHDVQKRRSSQQKEPSQ